VHDAETTLSEAIDDVAGRARRPGSGATATVDPAAGTVLAAGRDRLTGAADTSRATPSHLPLHQVRPDARALIREAFTLSGDLHITGDTPGFVVGPAVVRAQHPGQGGLGVVGGHRRWRG
jgi:hypothetical protein